MSCIERGTGEPWDTSPGIPDKLGNGDESVDNVNINNNGNGDIVFTPREKSSPLTRRKKKSGETCDAKSVKFSEDIGDFSHTSMDGDNNLSSPATNGSQIPHQHHVTISEDKPFRMKTDNTYQGWDNPFRPEGELSHDAEEMLRLWKAGLLSSASADDFGGKLGEGDDVTKNFVNKSPSPAKMSKPGQNGADPSAGNGLNGHHHSVSNGNESRKNGRSAPEKSREKPQAKKSPAATGCCSLM